MLTILSNSFAKLEVWLVWLSNVLLVVKFSNENYYFSKF